MSRLVAALVLLAVWLLLWGELSAANVVSGVVVVGAVVAVDARLRAPRRHRVHPVRALLLLVDLVRRLVVASWAVVMTVLNPTPRRLSSGVVRVRMTTDSPVVTTLVADLITLTPGTLTLDARDGALFVHVLGLSDPDAVRAEVRELERLVTAAFTPLSDPRGARS